MPFCFPPLPEASFSARPASPSPVRLKSLTIFGAPAQPPTISAELIPLPAPLPLSFAEAVALFLGAVTSRCSAGYAPLARFKGLRASAFTLLLPAAATKFDLSPFLLLSLSFSADSHPLGHRLPLVRVSFQGFCSRFLPAV